MVPTKQPIYIAGPTGAGKSAVAVALAESIGGEIVNADAYQLYRGLAILTAKPTPDQLARVPHHLYSSIDPGSDFDAARYAKLAQPCIGEILSRGKIPVITGGSGLYLKALTHGLSPVPPSDPALRAQLDAQPLDTLTARFQQLDPAGAERTNLLNKRYVIRALEISILSGRPMSEIKNEWESKNPNFTGFLITRDRADLYQRINQRTTEMWQLGILEEVRQATQLSTTAIKAIGIQEIQAHLAGEISLDDCLDLIRQATRRYAKRQLSWFRREKGFQSVCLAPDDSPDSALEQIRQLFPALLSK